MWTGRWSPIVLFYRNRDQPSVSCPGNTCDLVSIFPSQINMTWTTLCRLLVQTHYDVHTIFSKLLFDWKKEKSVGKSRQDSGSRKGIPEKKKSPRWSPSMTPPPGTPSASTVSWGLMVCLRLCHGLCDALPSVPALISFILVAVTVVCHCSLWFSRPTKTSTIFRYSIS